MAEFEHLSKDKLYTVCDSLFKIQGGLDGLGSLLEFQSSEACYSPDDLFGVGQLLRLLSHELSIQEDILSDVGMRIWRKKETSPRTLELFADFIFLATCQWVFPPRAPKKTLGFQKLSLEK